MNKQSKKKIKKKDKRIKSTSRRKRPIPTRFTRIPEGFHTITPYLTINGAAKAIEFYKMAFGARKIGAETLSDGKILHATIKIGDSILMLSDEFSDSDTLSSSLTSTSVSKSTTTTTTTLVTLNLYSKNVDKLFKRAVDAGAKIVMPPGNQFWGERYGKLLDPFGHSWSVSMKVRMSPKEMEAKRRIAMEAFTR